ncbi:MAG: hypothetical protein AAF944_04640 [Bacteroidota bacterium]
MFTPEALEQMTEAVRLFKETEAEINEQLQQVAIRFAELARKYPLDEIKQVSNLLNECLRLPADFQQAIVDDLKKSAPDHLPKN